MKLAVVLLFPFFMIGCQSGGSHGGHHHQKVSCDCKTKEECKNSTTCKTKAKFKVKEGDSCHCG